MEELIKTVVSDDNGFPDPVREGAVEALLQMVERTTTKSLIGEVLYLENGVIQLTPDQLHSVFIYKQMLSMARTPGELDDCINAYLVDVGVRKVVLLADSSRRLIEKFFPYLKITDRDMLKSFYLSKTELIPPSGFYDVGKLLGYITPMRTGLDRKGILAIDCTLEDGRTFPVIRQVITDFTPEVEEKIKEFYEQVSKALKVLDITSTLTITKNGSTGKGI